MPGIDALFCVVSKYFCYFVTFLCFKTFCSSTFKTYKYYTVDQVCISKTSKNHQILTQLIYDFLIGPCKLPEPLLF